ncbi:uncharacterized protein K460DRAFT_350301 [Cucurbitaria berberidis CBS 394.84]|uniref:Uncharacterized protein n=1 Tax=Cucurbitaria berberidis CBS 394.84 TaxID=1168544 RepID=A0A9P4LCP7_9PLEO|nr:uncharacterized protein K460DRAFT_350301 [Cucurbitaria berberidis CBS 394.84]KAF1850220.1 hypothetical protein K460DRAFT_350301 [Cucurbitaria berberidis CBS 394.84]
MSSLRYRRRILLTSVKDSRNRNTLPFSLNTIKALQEHWHLADLCFYNQGQDLGACAMTFSPMECDFGVKGIYVIIPNLNFCECAMIHDPATRSTWAVVFNLPTWTIDTLLQYLGHAKDIAHMPFLVPILLANAASGGLWDREYEAYGHFNTIRIAMKCDKYDRSAIKVDPRDLADMPRKLTASADNVATVVSFAANLERIMKFLDSHFDEYHKQAPPAVSREVRDHLHWLQQLIEDVTVKNETVRSAGQSVVQMVYAVLQQRDNEINHQHGGDMRVIAIVTLMFLPGTFLSTWFSASFWNFNPKEGGPVASKWGLFHFGVSIAMTLAIFIAWRNDSLARRKKRNKPRKSKSKNSKASRWTGKVIRKLKRSPTTQVEEGDVESVDDDDDDGDETDGREKGPSPWDSLRQKIVPLAQRRKHSTAGGGEIVKMVRKTAPRKDNMTIAEENVKPTPP